MEIEMGFRLLKRGGPISDCTPADLFAQRQTVVSQFFQLDRLVVEGGKSVCIPLEQPLDELEY